MDLSTLGSVVNAGGVVAFAIVVVLLLITGKLVPGYLYDREVARSEKLNDQVDQNTKAQTAALDRLTDEVRRRDRVG